MPFHYFHCCNAFLLYSFSSFNPFFSLSSFLFSFLFSYPLPSSFLNFLPFPFVSFLTSSLPLHCFHCYLIIPLSPPSLLNFLHFPFVPLSMPSLSYLEYCGLLSLVICFACYLILHHLLPLFANDLIFISLHILLLSYLQSPTSSVR